MKLHSYILQVKNFGDKELERRKISVTRCVKISKLCRLDRLRVIVMGNDTNSLPDLLELLLKVVPNKGKSKAFDVSAELRITKGIVEGDEDLCFEVALKRVWLDLDLVGLDPTSGTRFGEPVKDNEAEMKRKTSHEVIKHAEAHGKNRQSLADGVARFSCC
jgi:hypothetical protein